MRALLLLPLLVATPLALAGQAPASVGEERRAWAEWLASSPASPFAALMQRNIGPGLTLGPPDSDIPLTGIAAGYRVVERNGTAILETAGAPGRPLPRRRQVRLGPYRLMVSGPAGRALLSVSDTAPRKAPAPAYYDYDRALVFEVRLGAPARPATVRLLAADGQEVDADEAGVVTLRVGGAAISLVVRRIPDPEGEESDLEVYFRDQTNDHGSYPAGRWVSLTPLGGDRYQLDLNRARNPFCAYSSVFACPAPWRGNAIPRPVAAGERYHGGALSPLKGPS